MSRKDPRRRIVVPVTAVQRAWLRRMACEGSLGDALRRVVQYELQTIDMAEHLRQASLQLDIVCGADQGASGLPLQLPRRVRLELEEMALRHQLSTSAIIAHLLAQRCGGLEVVS